MSECRLLRIENEHSSRVRSTAKMPRNSRSERCRYPRVTYRRAGQLAGQKRERVGNLPTLVVNKTWLCWPVTASSRGFLLPVHIGDLPRTAPRRPKSRRTTTASASYVDNWLRTHQAVADLINSFSGLKTDINQ